MQQKQEKNAEIWSSNSSTAPCSTEWLFIRNNYNNPDPQQSSKWDVWTLSVHEILGEYYLCDLLHVKFWSAQLVETLLSHEAKRDDEEAPKKKKKNPEQQ